MPQALLVSGPVSDLPRWLNAHRDFMTTTDVITNIATTASSNTDAVYELMMTSKSFRMESHGDYTELQNPKTIVSANAVTFLPPTHNLSSLLQDTHEWFGIHRVNELKKQLEKYAGWTADYVWHIGMNSETRAIDKSQLSKLSNHPSIFHVVDHNAKQHRPACMYCDMDIKINDCIQKTHSYHFPSIVPQAWIGSTSANWDYLASYYVNRNEFYTMFRDYLLNIVAKGQTQGWIIQHPDGYYTYDLQRFAEVNHVTVDWFITMHDLPMISILSSKLLALYLQNYRIGTLSHDVVLVAPIIQCVGELLNTRIQQTISSVIEQLPNASSVMNALPTPQIVHAPVHRPPAPVQHRAPVQQQRRGPPAPQQRRGPPARGPVPHMARPVVPPQQRRGGPVIARPGPGARAMAMNRPPPRPNMPGLAARMAMMAQAAKLSRHPILARR